jgi:type IV pilus assembly protein PilE
MRRDKHLAMRTAGFTLIELLVALTCMGILLAWASTQYPAYMQRSQRAHARTMLLQTALWMERHASANGSYPLPQNIPSSIGAATDVIYQLQVISSSDSFTLMAIPTGKQRDDPCGTLTLSHTGVREVKNASISANDCWQR